MESASELAIFVALLALLLAASVQQLVPYPPPTAVGIDLGTTFSCVATYHEDHVRVLPNQDKNTITASNLFVDAHDMQLIIGDRARTAAAHRNGALLYDAKRFIGKRWPADGRDAEKTLPFALEPRASKQRRQSEPHLAATLGDGPGQRLTLGPEEVGALIVERLKATAEAAIGRAVDKAVLAVPVGFDANQINATREAAELAGFEVLRIIHEPTAAAMAYGLHNAGASMTVMVYDMGGGTLDVSLLNLDNGIFEVMAAAGDNRLGGQDFSAALVDVLVDSVAARLGGDGDAAAARMRADSEAMRALREEAERLKIALNDECDCSGRFYDGDAGAVVDVRLPPSLAAAGPLTLSRTEFEAATAHLFERALAPVERVLARIDFPAAEVDEIVLVGGSSRMARVRGLLRDHFGGREPNCNVSPEEAVAHGTAIQAAILTDQKKISVGASEAALHKHVDDR